MSTSHQERAISKGAFSQVAFALLPYLPLYREPMYYVLPLLNNVHAFSADTDPGIKDVCAAGMV
jgi:hypothetical protein